MNQETLERLRYKTSLLPQEPGVYIMKDRDGKIIYVGKAKSLRNRVSSYFRSVDKHLPKVYKMVERVDSFDYIVTDSEFEALVLECSLIKLHTPRYNILLKDDKGYYYIRIDQRPFGRITAEKQQKDKDALFLGPYVSSLTAKETVDEANKTFRLPTCNRRFPQDFGKERPCLNYYINQCMGVCTGRISAESYQETLEEAVEFIKSGGGQAVEALTKKMEAAAEALDFERAARCRDLIAAIHKVTERQKVIAYNHKSLDVIGTVQSLDTLYLSVLVFRQGRLRDKRDYTFDLLGSLEQMLGEFILGCYMESIDRPAEIFLDTHLPDGELIIRLIEKQSGHKLKLTVPQRGQGRQLIEMARNNAAQSLSLKTRRTGREVAAVDELGRLLGLNKPPIYIEAYDISNYGGQTIVGGMIIFENGRPAKKLYKRFTIKEQAAPDDYAAMDQMLSRRVARYLEEKGQEGFGRLPDLWLIDGGATHVAVAQKVLDRYGLAIPVFGMAKDNRHRTRAITSQSEEIVIAKNRGVFALVTSIQDEVHRYAISFSRKKHKQNSLTAVLLGVEGIGPARMEALYRRFKTNQTMKAATVEELAATDGMNRTVAQKLYDFLHKND